MRIQRTLRRSSLVRQEQMIGFTLVELMVVIVILSALVLITAPNVKQMMLGSRLAAASNNFVGLMNYARNEAAKRGVRVSMCKSSDGSTCTTAGDWSQGGIVFVDSVTPIGVRATSESIIRKIPATPSVTITGGGSGAGVVAGRDYVSYMPTGLPKTASNTFFATTFSICAINAVGSANKKRNVVMSVSGRVKIDTVTGACP